MIKRNVYIGNPAYLRLDQSQLIVQNPDTKELKGNIPVEDMAVLVLDHVQITLSTQLIRKLMEHTVAVIACDGRHLPNGLMLPLDGHSELSQRWRHQLEASAPLKRNLWKQTVIAKISNQKQLLKQYQKPYDVMDFYLKNTSSGDERNMEAKAANHYWKYIFEDFTRDRFGSSPNNYLNFGYAILRSMVARALVSSGMLPALGIFHRNKYNSYCLADDIMEPYRPYVDASVLEWCHAHPTEEKLNKEAKAHLLNIAVKDVWITGKKRPLMVAITVTTASLYACFAGEKRVLNYPNL